MKTVNIVIAGLGGQGIVKASDILADAAFRAGHDVKKAEVHGMSQRGGSVNTDIRYGSQVLSPMVPDGEADVLVTMDVTQIENNRYRLKPDGKLLSSECLKDFEHGPARAATVAMLGVLSACLDLPEDAWHAAIRGALPEKHHAMNLAAFAAGRHAGIAAQSSGRP
ncbi:MAG: 2-oxoacid:acceptor oxidoreductase family protein [Kiritimatiellae bacterium]|nr:2-oxoacid:acceptor oxidoreductase family protein [Kiritimatiellia bacterium]